MNYYLSLFFLSTVFESASLAQCIPPALVIDKLRASFAYQLGLGQVSEKVGRFTVLRIEDRVFLRHNNPGPRYDPGRRPVYIFAADGKESMEGIDCPSSPEWINCAVESALNARTDEEKAVNGNGEPKYTASALKKAACEFSLDVPLWKPSPDDDGKRKVAAEILQELREHGYDDVKEIYLRNFNLNDPDIMVHIIDSGGESVFRGCAFLMTRTPHCYWHGFGQAPVELLKQDVMALPYRLYPSPVGKP